jgi:hypothetical protein
MASLRLAVLLSALVAGVGAQSPATSLNATVWAAVAFVMHGERTPLKGPLATTLTPAGAQQLWSQGSAFRSRYLSGGFVLSENETRVTNRAPINDIERNAIDNWQLSILSNTDDYVTQGALAFMQGLYPPLKSAFPDNVGGLNISLWAPTGAFVDYPMNGYQYPAIETLSVLEESSVAYVTPSSSPTHADPERQHPRTCWLSRLAAVDCDRTPAGSYHEKAIQPVV